MTNLKQEFKKSIRNSFSFSTVGLICLIIVILAGLAGGFFYFKIKPLPVEPRPEEEVVPEKEAEEVVSEEEIPPSPSAEVSFAIAAKRLIKEEDIVEERAEVTPQIPEYSLPLKTKDISNFEDFSQKVGLSREALALLEKNGFAVLSTPETLAKKPDRFANFYSILKNKDIPIFITTDSLLHYYHIFFDTSLMKLERDLFYDDIFELSKNFWDEAVDEYNANSGDLKESAKRNVAYFSVALELLRPKAGQIVSDETLKEEYCPPGISAEYCEITLEGVKSAYGEKVSFKYFSPQDLEKYKFEIPDFVKNEVQKELELIEAHEGWQFSPIFIYKEDYSQYVPRGHYTKSEKLKNYFKALMWYGRMTNLIKGSEDLPQGKSLRKVQEEGLIMGGEKGLISTYDAKIQTLQSLLIANKFSQSKDIQERWQRMYAITSFFVGFSDDLGPYEYGAVLNSIFKEKITSQEIEKNFSALKNSLSDIPYNPKIYSGLDAVQLVMPCPPLSEKDIENLKIQAKKLLENTKGFRLMGQRFTVDSWLFSEIVSPYSGEFSGQKLPLPTREKPFTFTWDDKYAAQRNVRPFTWVKTDVAGCPPPAEREVRGFPRGLDIMALFGSERAKEILKELGDTEYSDYEKKFSELKAEIDSLPRDAWFKNIYWNWLYVLKSLLGKFGQGYQTFMAQEAWQDKELNTALASWTELRHDTILYVKQSYTMAELGMGLPPPPVVGYVEPVPEFYSRLLTLTKMTNKGLKNLVPEEELEKLKIGYGLDRFAGILEKLLEISKKELENKVLSDEDYRFIENFGKTSENLIEIISGGDIDPDVLKTVLVADVHTEGNTEKVLEEGVGYIKTLIAAYKLPQGHILLGAGPVFSYYEFKQPMKDRLTDEAWREILDGEHPSEPGWIKSFSVK